MTIFHLGRFGGFIARESMMKTSQETFTFYYGVVLYPLLFVLMMWFVYWFELRFGVDFTAWGVRPRTGKGLRGILFSPFIHSGIKHLWHNTAPMIVLSTALFYFYRKISWRVLLWIVVLSGLGTWMIGRPSFHIGMSGVIYGLASFLFFKGIRAKHFRLIALSLLVVFLYGSLIWGTLPLDQKVSWEGHLSGFIAGMVLGVFCFRESVPQKPQFIWEKDDYEEEEDPFMQQFDEHGNFFELPKEQEQIEEEPIFFRYSFKSEDSEE